MMSTEKIVPKNEFFCPALSFRKKVRNYDQDNRNGQLNALILDEIKKYATQYLVSLFELSDNDEWIKKYCYLDHHDFTAFWDELLESNILVNQLGMEEFIDLLPLDNIHSLDLIKACYWCNKGNHLKAVSYGSYHSGCILLNDYIHQQSDLLFLEIEAHLKHLAVIYLAPGQLLLAKLYFNEELHSQCSAHLIIASQQFEDSAYEIHNTGCTREEIGDLIVKSQMRTITPLLLSEQTLHPFIR